VFRGDFDKRQGWGWHEMARWELFFSTLKEIGQVKNDVDVGKVVTNEFVSPANDFDKTKVAADADSYELPEDMAAVDVALIQDRFCANAVR
jgi:NitT/TauT family transport system substrate-binding protein